METVKFLNDINIYMCELTSYSDRKYNKMRICFTGDTVPPLTSIQSGFHTLNSYNNYEEGNYTTLKYIFLKENDNTFILTESPTDIWSEPIEIPPIVVDPYVPTEEEILLQLETAKKVKITESKSSLKTYLEMYQFSSDCHNNTLAKYSITEEKQVLMATEYINYQVGKTNNEETVLKWNETGKVSEIWTETEFTQLMVEIKNFVAPLVVKQQKYEEQIKSVTTMEGLNQIVIFY